MSQKPTWFPIYICRYPEKNKEFFDTLFRHTPFLKQHNFTESEIRRHLRRDYRRDYQSVWTDNPVIKALHEISDLISLEDAVFQNDDLRGMVGVPRDQQNETFIARLKEQLNENRLCWPKGGLAIGVLGFTQDRFVNLWTFDGMEWCNAGHSECIKDYAILNAMPPDETPDYGLESSGRTRSRMTQSSVPPDPELSRTLLTADNFDDSPEIADNVDITPQIDEDNHLPSPALTNSNGGGAAFEENPALVSFSNDEIMTPELPRQTSYSHTSSVSRIRRTVCLNPRHRERTPSKEVQRRPTIQGSCTFEDISQECPTWFLNLEVHKRQRLCKLYREYQAESGLLYRELSSPGTRTEMDRNLRLLNILRDDVMEIFKDEGLRGIEVQQINDFMKWRQDYYDPTSQFSAVSAQSICDFDLDRLQELPIDRDASEDLEQMDERYQTIGHFLTRSAQEDPKIGSIFPPSNTLVSKYCGGVDQINGIRDAGIEIDWKTNRVTKVQPESWADTPRGMGVEIGWQLQCISLDNAPKQFISRSRFEEAVNSGLHFVVTFSQPADESPILDTDWSRLNQVQLEDEQNRFRERHRQECWHMLRHLRPIEHLDDHKGWVLRVIDELYFNETSYKMPMAIHFEVCENPKILWLYIQVVSSLFNLVARQSCRTCFRCGLDLQTTCTDEWRFTRAMMTLWLLRLRSHPSGKLRIDRKETCEFFGLTEQQYQWFFSPTLGEIASLEVYQFDDMAECLNMIRYHIKNEQTVLPELLQSVYNVSDEESDDDLLPPPSNQKMFMRLRSQRMNKLRQEYQYGSVLANWVNSGQAISRIDSMKKKNPHLEIDFRVRYQFRYNENREGHQNSWAFLKKSLQRRKRRKYGGFISKMFMLSSSLEIEDMTSTPDHSPETMDTNARVNDMPYLRIMKLYFGFSHIFMQCDPIVSSDSQWSIITGMKKANLTDELYPHYENKAFYNATGLSKEILKISIRKMVRNYHLFYLGNSLNDTLKNMGARDFTQNEHKAQEYAPKILMWLQPRHKIEKEADGSNGSDTIPLIVKVIHFDAEESDDHADHHPSEAWHHFRLNNAKCDDVVELYAILKDEEFKRYYVIQEFGDNDLEKNILMMFESFGRKRNHGRHWYDEVWLGLDDDMYILQNKVFLPIARQLHAVIWRMHNCYKSTHNDIKPRNIVLCKAYADETLGFSMKVKLIDFGQMQYCPPLQRYFMLEAEGCVENEVEYNSWRSYEHCGTEGYWSIEKLKTIRGRIPDSRGFPTIEIDIPKHMEDQFEEDFDDEFSSDSEEENSDEEQKSEEEEEVLAADAPDPVKKVNLFSPMNRHDRLSDENKKPYEARKAELFALAMTYFFILFGEKPFESVRKAFQDKSEWKKLMCFTDGQYLKLGGDKYRFAPWIERKMMKKSKQKLEPHIVEYIRRLTLPEPDRPPLIEESLDECLKRIEGEMRA